MQNIVRNAVLKAQELLKLSDSEYCKAEECLLAEIGINMSTIMNSGLSVKSFSESFGLTGRLDAEYYQDRHKKLISALNATGTIRTKCNIYDKTYAPISSLEYKYIELANIGKYGEINDVDIIPGAELPTRARRIVHKGQILVSSIEGSLESCALVTSEYDNALCSTGFYVIDSTEYNSEMLLVLLKSKPIQSLLKRGCSGTILTNISKGEFLNIPLPNVKNEVQEEVRKRISSSYCLRNQSNKILECAKQAVEIAIEQDEATAIAWLNTKIPEFTEGQKII